MVIEISTSRGLCTELILIHRHVLSIGGSTFSVKNTGVYRCIRDDAASIAAGCQAGGVLLMETVRATGLNRVLSKVSAP